MTEVTKLDPIRAATTMKSPIGRYASRYLGHRWRAANVKGAPRYIMPSAVVPMIAMRDFW